MTDELCWDSNKTRVADREYFVGRVRNGRLEIVTDHKTGNFVGVHLKSTGNTPPTAVDQTFDIVIGDPS